MNKNQLENLFTLCRELPQLRAETYIRLCRIANKHRRLCEHACNVGMNDAEQVAHEKKLCILANQFDFQCQSLAGFDPVSKRVKVDKSMCPRTHEQRDPRGATLRLILPSGRYNTMDGETWAL